MEPLTAQDIGVLLCIVWFGPALYFIMKIMLEDDHA